MAKIKNPILFSKYFGIEDRKLHDAGLIDPFLNVDTQLFIDPVMLEKSSNEIIKTKSVEKFRKHFESFVRLLAISKREGDAPWKAAQKLLDLHEPPENGLGYGGSGRSGSSRPDEVRDAMIRTSSEIVQLGSEDPEMISLMGFFEEDVGPDTISDFTTRVIIGALAEVTQLFCEAHGIEVHDTDISQGFKLPRYIDDNGKASNIVLVPSDIVRELPIANDWSDIESAAFENAKIRNQVNSLLAGIAQPTVADRKEAMRRMALSSKEDFEMFMATVKEHVAYYDPNVDGLGYYRLKSIFANGFDGLKQTKPYEIDNGPDDLEAFVLDTISAFKHHVENGNLWEELWVGDKPKKERAAQLIYYAMADCFCFANDVDISPEANMGGGPIDFKFSKGYNARVLVEMKRSSGTVRHGYEKQLEIYKAAARTEIGVFVVIDYGDLGDKLAQIKAIRQQRLDAGLKASTIVVIDATPKASASKRK